MQGLFRYKILLCQELLTMSLQYNLFHLEKGVWRDWYSNISSSHSSGPTSGSKSMLQGKGEEKTLIEIVVVHFTLQSWVTILNLTQTS